MGKRKRKRRKMTEFEKQKLIKDLVNMGFVHEGAGLYSKGNAFVDLMEKKMYLLSGDGEYVLTIKLPSGVILDNTYLEYILSFPFRKNKRIRDKQLKYGRRIIPYHKREKK